MSSNARSLQLTSFARGSFALACVFAANLAHAVPEVCVNDDVGFASALDLARTSAVDIKLVQHTYHLDTTVWHNTSPVYPAFRAGSSLRGGYTASCAGRDIAVGNTTIVDNSGALYDGANIRGNATIEGLTFELQNGLHIGPDSSSSVPFASAGTLTFRRNIVRQTTGASATPLAIFWNEDPNLGGNIVLVDNLIYGNNGGSGVTHPAAVRIALGATYPRVHATNNTIVDNNGSLGGMAVVGTGAPIASIDNTIFFGNAGTDLYLQDARGFALTNDVIGSHVYGTAPLIAPSAITTGDPKLDANHRPIEAPPSPVINSGNPNATDLPATDLAGRARTVGSAPDRGAFESIINDSVLLSVTNTNDSGAGSLRAAILSANANGPSGGIVLFNIGTGCGPKVITLLTPLPNITSEVHVLANTQTGASANTRDIGDDAVICVILDGSTHNITDGLFVAANAPAAARLSVVGLAFSGFTHAAVGLYGGSGHSIVGSHIGGVVGGTPLDPVANGIIVGPAVQGVTIGGDDSALRNIIGEASNAGIVFDGPSGSLVGAHDNTVDGNYIGVGWSISNSDFVDRGNSISGVAIGGYANTVQNNVIGYNTQYGINIVGADAHDNAIYDNAIGHLPDDTAAGNGIGIVLQGTAHDASISSNVIATNLGAGVRVIDGQHDDIYGNVFFGNTGLALDLAGAGVTPNDNDAANQPPDYANRGINFPVVTTASGTNDHGTLSATLTSIPGLYIVDFYANETCDASGYGEGKYFVAEGNITIPASGTINGQGTGTLTSSSSFHRFGEAPFITAMARDTLGNTSEFSACFHFVSDTIFEYSFDP